MGAKLVVDPLGRPVADKLMEKLKPPVISVVMVDVPVPPAGTETEAGEAKMEKSGVGFPPSASIRLLPFGLPQPVAKS